ncbi:hypothetical protein HDV05_005274 [Chytridiales sp. JEL 0842]|nr:hypothetical protein HDV05_005274 [Chytridiales sp. JEL 0842]
MDIEHQRLQLLYALKKAESATTFDSNNSYSEALDAYREAITSMENVLAKTDEEWLNDNFESEGGVKVLGELDRRRIIELRNTYVQRVDALLANLPTDIGAVYNGKGFGSLSSLADQQDFYALSEPGAENDISLQASYDEFFEAVSMDDPALLGPIEDPPSDPNRNSFWLMRLLARTMRSGGMLTPRLHVPRHLWYQSGAKFVAIEAKFAACENIFIALNGIKDLDCRDHSAVKSALDEFETLLDNVRSSLSKKLRFLENERKGSESNASGDNSSSTKDSGGFKAWSSKLTRSLSTLGKGKAEKVADLSTYIELLARLFTTVQILESWMTYYEENQSQASSYCLDKLRRISGFFGTVVCAFVMRDFEILLERYLKKMGQVAMLPL